MTAPSEAYSCTLTEAGARARLPQARMLAARLRRRHRGTDRLVLDFTDDGHTRRLVDQFVRDESRCCAFFDFTVRERDGHVVLELAAPEGASDMLDAVMAAVDPTLTDEERITLQQSHAADPGTARPGGESGCGC